MSAQKWFAPSGEVFVEQTAASTDFKVIVKPIFSQLDFITSCTFWRTALMVVWYVASRRTPPFARTPSEPLTQPALSSSALAAARSNLQTSALSVFVEFI